MIPYISATPLFFSPSFSPLPTDTQLPHQQSSLFSSSSVHQRPFPVASLGCWPSTGLFHNSVMNLPQHLPVPQAQIASLQTTSLLDCLHQQQEVEQAQQLMQALHEIQKQREQTQSSSNFTTSAPLGPPTPNLPIVSQSVTLHRPIPRTQPLCIPLLAAAKRKQSGDKEHGDAKRLVKRLSSAPTTGRVSVAGNSETFTRSSTDPSLPVPATSAGVDATSLALKSSAAFPSLYSSAPSHSFRSPSKSDPIPSFSMISHPLPSPSTCLPEVLTPSSYPQQSPESSDITGHDDDEASSTNRNPMTRVKHIASDRNRRATIKRCMIQLRYILKDHDGSCAADQASIVRAAIQFIHKMGKEKQEADKEMHMMRQQLNRMMRSASVTASVEEKNTQSTCG